MANLFVGGFAIRINFRFKDWILFSCSSIWTMSCRVECYLELTRDKSNDCCGSIVQTHNPTLADNMKNSLKLLKQNFVCWNFLKYVFVDKRTLKACAQFSDSLNHICQLISEKYFNLWGKWSPVIVHLNWCIICSNQLRDQDAGVAWTLEIRNKKF